MATGSSPDAYQPRALQEAELVQHRLNNRLCLLIGHAQLLSMEPDLPPGVARTVATMLAAATDAVSALQRWQQLSRAAHPHPLDEPTGPPDGRVVNGGVH
jgi:hypothetical protein